MRTPYSVARLAQSVEHETLNLRVVGSSPTSGASFFFFFFFFPFSFFFLPSLFSMASFLSPIFFPTYLIPILNSGDFHLAEMTSGIPLSTSPPHFSSLAVSLCWESSSISGREVMISRCTPTGAIPATSKS